MTFLNPAILWGLFAVSIPVIIHIFNLKKTRKIEFSTLMFLKEIQETKQKRIKLKQLLILLCRIAFIMFLVMAFAGPLSKGFLGSVSERAPASVLIIFDDSFSMSSRSASGSAFETAKQTAAELLGTIDNSDEIYFTPVSMMDNYHKAYNDINTVLDSAGKLKLSDSRKNIIEILYKAKNILANSKYPSKEIFFITDGQSSMFTKDYSAAEKIFGDDTRLTIVTVSERTANNISVDSIDIKTKIFTPGRPVKLAAIIKNHNNFNVTGCSAVFTSGTYRDERVIDIPAGSSSPAEFSVIPGNTGFISGKIEITCGGINEDEFIKDNARSFVIYIPDEIKILSVSQNQDDSRFINLAISTSQTMAADSTAGQSGFYKVKTAPELTGERLSEFNCVVIINKNSFTAGEAEALKEYTGSGGGVIIYPGKSSNINNYNEALFRTLELPFLPQWSHTNAVFEKADFSHPVFEGVFKSSGGDIKSESPNITSYIPPQQGTNSQTLVSLNDGNNFLVQYLSGRGKILVYAVPPDNSCSDFPVSGIFAPLTIRSIGHVSKVPEPDEAYPGDDFYFNPFGYGSFNDEDTVKLYTPDEKSFVIPVTGDYSSILNIGDKTGTAGVYYIKTASKVIYGFPVNTDPEESLTGISAPEEIKDFTGKFFTLKTEVIETGGNLAETVHEAQTGEMLWQYFIIAAILFISAEFLLAKSILTVKNRKA